MTPLQAYLNSPRARRALSKKPGEEGFSLIELVVVVAVLAVLSAIAIPNFTNISNKARASAAASTVATIVKECAAKIADTGSGSFRAPTLNGYGWAMSLNGTNVTANSAQDCHVSTGVYEAKSTDTTAYPTWRYDIASGEKTCIASGAALARGCPTSGGGW